MQYAIDIPNFGSWMDASTLADLAREAEDSGWDGFFIWDHIDRPEHEPNHDVTVLLTTIALATQRIRFGAMVTPLPRRRPHKVARELVTLDHLSGGRVVLGVGTGGNVAEFDRLGEAGDAVQRGQMLDEALEVLAALWSAEPVTYHGQHYTLVEATFRPAPVQRPRIPIWVAGRWPNNPPFRRAARWDGVAPISIEGGHRRVLSPDELRDCLAYTLQHRQSNAPFDVIMGGMTDASGAAEIINPYQAAGATWWREMLFPTRFSGDVLAGMRARIAQGPPA